MLLNIVVILVLVISIIVMAVCIHKRNNVVSNFEPKRRGWYKKHNYRKRSF